jgi:hypothetical protein
MCLPPLPAPWSSNRSRRSEWGLAVFARLSVEQPQLRPSRPILGTRRSTWPCAATLSVRTGVALAEVWDRKQDRPDDRGESTLHPPTSRGASSSASPCGDSDLPEPERDERRKTSEPVRGQNPDEAGATPRLDARCVTGSVGSLPPRHAGSVIGFGRVPKRRQGNCTDRNSQVTNVRLSHRTSAFHSVRTFEDFRRAWQLGTRKKQPAKIHTNRPADSRNRANQLCMRRLLSRACRQGEIACHL